MKIISFKKWVVIVYIWIVSVLLEILFTPSGIEDLGQRLMFFNAVIMISLAIPVFFVSDHDEWVREA